MNGLTHGIWQPGRRSAALDPFSVRALDEKMVSPADRGPDAGYGCVDWYVYAPQRSAHQRRRAAGQVAIRGGRRQPSPDGAQ